MGGGEVGEGGILRVPVPIPSCEPVHPRVNQLTQVKNAELKSIYFRN